MLSERGRGGRAICGPDQYKIKVWVFAGKCFERFSLLRPSSVFILCGFYCYLCLCFCDCLFVFLRFVTFVALLVSTIERPDSSIMFDKLQDRTFLSYENVSDKQLPEPRGEYFYQAPKNDFSLIFDWNKINVPFQSLNLKHHNSTQV